MSGLSVTLPYFPMQMTRLKVKCLLLSIAPTLKPVTDKKLLESDRELN